MLEAAWRRDVLCCSEERENRPAQQTREFHHIRTSSVREEYVGSDAAEICCTSFIGSFLGGLAIYPTSRLACEATEMGKELMAIRNLFSTRVRFANAIDLWTDSPCCGDNFDWRCLRRIWPESHTWPFESTMWSGPAISTRGWDSSRRSSTRTRTGRLRSRT